MQGSGTTCTTPLTEAQCFAYATETGRSYYLGSWTGVPTGCAYDYISSSVGMGIRYNVNEGVSCQDDENCVCDGTEEPFETVISGTCEFPIATYEA